MTPNIIFDMDGVLIDSERLYDRAWRQVSADMNLPDVDDCLTQCVGRNSRDTSVILMERYGPTFNADLFRDEIRAAFAAIVETEGLPLKPGTIELLDWLRTQGWPLALATSTGRQSAERHLKSVGLFDYFSTIITGDMVSVGKPAPDIYLLAAEKIGASPQDCIAIEDSPNGVKSAYTAGLKTILVPDMLDPDPEIRQLALRVFPSLVEVKTFLEGLSY